MLVHHATPADKILLVDRALEAAGVPFAFGGAIARNYYAEVRTTVDIDVGVFLRPEEHQQVLDVVGALFPIRDRAEAQSLIERDGQVRLWWESTPIDLFFSYDALHDESATRVRRVPFAERTIPILSPEDLIIHKITFARSKDWRDVADMLYRLWDALDLAYIRRWLGTIFPAAGNVADPRVALFEELYATVARSRTDPPNQG